MIQVLIKIFDSDVGWMDWRFKKVWSRARLKSNTLVVNKKLNRQWIQNGKKGSDARLIQRILELTVDISTNLSFTDEKCKDRERLSDCAKDYQDKSQGCTIFFTPNLTYFIDNALQETRRWDWILILENWWNIDGTRREKRCQCMRRGKIE